MLTNLPAPLVGAFSVIVQHRRLIVCSTTIDYRPTHLAPGRSVRRLLAEELLRCEGALLLVPGRGLAPHPHVAVEHCPVLCSLKLFTSAGIMFSRTECLHTDLPISR